MLSTRWKAGRRKSLSNAREEKDGLAHGNEPVILNLENREVEREAAEAAQNIRGVHSHARKRVVSWEIFAQLASSRERMRDMR